MAEKRVCVIGAGPSGMSALINFEKFRKAGKNVPEIVCYEKQEDWGGLWNLTWQTGLDKYGEKVCSSMYRHLWSNGPKEGLELGDYTFTDHFKKPIPSFPPRDVLRDYLVGRWKQYNVKDKIRFNHAVHRVTFDENTHKFTVLVRDLPNKKEASELFDYVIVCSGHFSTPLLPDIPDLQHFNGRLLHAHEFRDASQFAGQRVLVVGGSYSAEDIALQVHKFGAKQVTISYRSSAMGFKWPGTITEHPIITHVQDKTVTFKDGHSCEVDAIITCTGYLFDTWFMADNLRFEGRNIMYPDENVYKSIVWQKGGNNQLFYIAFVDQYLTFTLFDVETYYVAKVILGEIKLPSSEEMRADWQKWKTRANGLKTPIDDINFQKDQAEDLGKISGYPYPLDVAQIFIDWEHDKDQDILNYRDQAHFTSVHDGTVAATPTIPWIKAMDDSIETFLKLC